MDRPVPESILEALKELKLYAGKANTETSECESSGEKL